MHQRGCTIADVDTAAQTFTMQFLIHEPTGPAAQWELKAAPGDALDLTRYGSKPVTAPFTSGVVLVADAAGIAFANACMGELPARISAQAWLQEHPAFDREIPVTSQAGATLRWLGPSAQALTAEAAAFDFSGHSVEIVTEASRAKTLKKHLISRRGVPRSRVRSQA